jgi:ribosomal protein S12 methylthiotransferase accessory factor
LIADITSSDVRTLGLHVLRAIIPGFQPLYMGHSVRSLGSRRLGNVPSKLGFSQRAAHRDEGQAPHPYP